MNSTLLATLIIVLGEILAIYAEIMAAKLYANPDNSFWVVFIKLAAVLILASFLLMGGYMIGLRAFKNIWIVSAVSITSILITEPFIAYAITRQLPTRGALIGFILGAVGLIVTIFG